MNAKQERLEEQKILESLTIRETLQKNRIEGVQTVLVVLSSSAMVYDIEALRQKILQTYPDSAIFFRTTSGKAMGVSAPQLVDLLIDLTGPGQRQGWFYARKLRKTSKFAVGRNAGWFRKRLYDRIFDEKSASLPEQLYDQESFVQAQVLALAGVALTPTGEVTADRAKLIALDLPPLGDD